MLVHGICSSCFHIICVCIYNFCNVRLRLFIHFSARHTIIILYVIFGCVCVCVCLFFVIFTILKCKITTQWCDAFWLWKTNCMNTCNASVSREHDVRFEWITEKKKQKNDSIWYVLCMISVHKITSEALSFLSLYARTECACASQKHSNPPNAKECRKCFISHTHTHTHTINGVYFVFRALPGHNSNHWNEHWCALSQITLANDAIFFLLLWSESLSLLFCMKT